jgi:hypothetical protein
VYRAQLYRRTDEAAASPGGEAAVAVPEARPA